MTILSIIYKHFSEHFLCIKIPHKGANNTKEPLWGQLLGWQTIPYFVFSS